MYGVSREDLLVATSPEITKIVMVRGLQIFMFYVKILCFGKIVKKKNNNFLFYYF